MIQIEQYGTNKWNIKKIGGIDGLMYKVEKNKIIFKFYKEKYIYIKYIINELIDNEEIINIFINGEKIKNPSEIEKKLQDVISITLEIELSDMEICGWENYTLFLVKNYLPTMYYFKKEYGRNYEIFW